MKIRIECKVMHRYRSKRTPNHFLIWNNRVSTKQIRAYPHYRDSSLQDD